MDTNTSAGRPADLAPASSGQRRLWFMDRLVPGSPANNVARAYRTHGELSQSALRAAWLQTQRRHEILRTTLTELDGELVQVVAPGAVDSLTFVDLSHLPEPEREPRAGATFAAQAEAPFDRTAPLTRLSLLRLSEQDHLLVLIQHHAVTDGWSAPILLEELSAQYAAALAGAEADLPPLPLQYRDFARWQRQQADEPGYQRRLERWRQRLDPLPARPALPSDHRHPAQPNLRGRTIRFDWGPELAGGIAELARAQAVTPFVVMLTALQALLHRLTAVERVVVGTPTAGRARPELDRLIGCFVNPLPLCTDLSGDPSFRELLGRAQQVVLDALDDQDVCFEHIVAAVDPPHDPSRHPLFDVMLVMQSVPERPLRLAGTESQIWHADNQAAKFDLTVCIEQAEPSWCGWLELSTDLFEPRTGELLLEQARTLLTAAVADPDRAVSQLPLEHPEQTRRALADADAISGAAAPAASVPELVRRRAQAQPEAEAVRCTSGTVSYRELVARADRLAAALRANRVLPGTAVAVALPPGASHVVALLGILTAGCYFVSLQESTPEGAGRQVFRELAPSALIASGPGDPLAAGYAAEAGGVVLTEPDAAGYPAGQDPPAPVPLDGRAYVAYTSGSTGVPKGIIQSHRGLAQFVTWLGAEFRFGPGRRVAQWAAVSYDAAYCEIFATLVAGGTLCPVPDRLRTDAGDLPGWLARERVEVFQTVPSFAAELVSRLPDSDALPAVAGTLDTVLLAGEPFAGELAAGIRRLVPGVRLVNLYGPTETILATWHEVADPEPGTLPVGRSIPGRQVMVVDGQGRPCPAGVTGELVVRSPYLSLGYLGRPAETAPAFAPLPGDDLGCYRTGDLGRRRSDGRLEFTGRRDEQIKLRGVRLDLAGMEAVLAGHDSVQACAVVAEPGRDGLAGRLVAYVVPRFDGAGNPLGTEPDWRAQLRSHFTEPTLPAVFVPLAELPRTASGKVDRDRLPAPDPDSPAGWSGRPGRAGQPDRPDRPDRPVSAEEQRIMAICAEVLRRDRIGVDENFFSAGGHSLLATQVLNRIREEFEVDIPLRKFFAAPTPAELARLLEPAAGEDDDLAELLAQISALTDEEVQQFVKQHSDRVAQ